MNLLRLLLPPSEWSGWGASGRRRANTIVGWPDATSDHPTRVHPGPIHITTTIGKDGDTTKVTGGMKITIAAMDTVMTSHLRTSRYTDPRQSPKETKAY